MAIGQIETKFFLSPREAIEQIIGPETYGLEWEANLDVTDKRIEGALRNLYKALQSGVVAAFHSISGGFERTLTAVEAANEFFKIDIARDYCVFGSTQWPPNELKINREDLQKFMAIYRPKAIISLASSELKCEQWLIKLMKDLNTELPKTDLLFKEAVLLFAPLSRRAYDRARANAIKVTKRSDLSSGGRPRGPRGNIARLNNPTTAPE